MADPLIRTKLSPPFTRPELVPRPRLTKQIALGLHCPLTLVTAPAGFGKTTLVASFVAGSGLPVAWLSLDKDDNRDGRFLNYLVAALQKTNEAVGSEAAQLIKASQQIPHEVVLTSLINDLDTAGTEISLVLDDYHFINSQAVHAAVTFLLEHAPCTFHLVIASRSDPPLPLARFRARDQVVELRTAALSFTDSEAAQFLNDIMDLRLDAGSIAVLAARTEGWVAGLQMAALSMRDREDTAGFIDSFSGTNRHILDYLLEEVLARESEAVQAFLLQTAILNRLTGPLCDAVTGAYGGQELLESLERRNLFVVPLDDKRCWYRYHHLFADLMKARLQKSGPDRIRRLTSRAATWCEQNGHAGEAISYAFAAKEFETAARLVEKNWGRNTSRGEIETVWSWLNALPEETVRNSAPLSAATCWVLWLTGQFGAIEEHLEDAERAMNKLAASNRSEGDDASFAALPAELAVLRAFVARYQSEFETASALADRASSLIPKELPPRTSTELEALVFLAQAMACDGAGNVEEAVTAYAESIRLSRLRGSTVGVGITYRLVGNLRLLGRLREADVACREALEFVQAQGMARLPAVGILHVAMSEVLVEQNELAAAEARIAQSIELGKWSGRLDPVRNAAPTLTRLRLARGDALGALAAIEEAVSALGEPPSPLAKAELLALKARLLLRQGAPNEAARCVAEAEGLAGRERGLTGEMVALAALRIKLATSSPDQAIAELTRSIADAEESGRLGTVIELRILRSLALARQSLVREAEIDLERALTLAKSEGYVRVFLDEGQPAQLLLAQWLAHASTHPLQEYAIYLLSQFEAEQHTTPVSQEIESPTTALAVPLSERELEVLHIMALGRTNREIARQLVVAPGTVKAHTASIYRKLDVANRTEAVARARELGILP